MRVLFMPLIALLLASCGQQPAAPAGNEQAVIDKADQDMITAEAEAAK
jgi:uncharacterized protein YcfL